MSTRFRKPTRRLLATGAVVAFAAALILSGCSDSDSDSASSNDSVERGAAAACPESSGSERAEMTFTNMTSDPILLQVPNGSWSCAGWSGVSTPGSLNGVVIDAGATVVQRLEGLPAFRSNDDWERSNFDLKFRTSKNVGSSSQLIAFGGDATLRIKYFQKSVNCLLTTCWEPTFFAKTSRQESATQSSSTPATSPSGQSLRITWETRDLQKTQFITISPEN